MPECLGIITLKRVRVKIQLCSVQSSLPIPLRKSVIFTHNKQTKPESPKGQSVRKFVLNVVNKVYCVQIIIIRRNFVTITLKRRVKGSRKMPIETANNNIVLFPGRRSH